MKFDNYESVANTVQSLVAADLPRSSNRALINELFNGEAPWTEAEKEANNVNTNVNFLDATKIAHNARNTFNNAFLKPGNFFSVKLDSPVIFKRDSWARSITKNLMRPMKKSPAYIETLRTEFAQTVLHGVGPSYWSKKHKWCPEGIGIEDVLVPGRTKCSLSNLEYFSIYQQYTPSQLYGMTHGKNVDKAWNMKLVNEILKRYEEQYIMPQTTSMFQSPEKMAEMVKSDVGLYESEATPSINVREFYYRDDESDDEKWFRKIILDSESGGEVRNEFIYDPKKRVCATDRSHILHVMFGDGANVAPFRYHSVRGLGFLLYAVCHLQNRLMCKFNDSVFEQFLWYFRVSNPEDRERLNKLDLHHLGIIPDGLNFVTGSERYSPNPNLVTSLFSINRQNMNESSAQYRQDADTGSSKEKTATETMAQVNAANALVGAMLGLAYTLQTEQYREIARRFCIKDSTDPDVKQFRKDCLRDGVPPEMLDIDRWEIEPERVLGAGNKTLEMAQAQQLMAVRNLLDPDAAREVLHIFVEANTDDPKIAERLVPMGKKKISDSIHDAQLAAGTLMLGMPVSMKSGINHVEYIQSMILSMASVMKQIEATGNTAEMEEVFGLQNMAQHIGEHINQLAQDESQKENVKKFGDALGRMMNMVKGLEQRAQEELQSQNQNGQITPEAQAKIASSTILAQTSAQIKEQAAAQKRAHKEQDFLARQARDDVKVQADIDRKQQQFAVDVQGKDVMTAAEIQAAQLKAQNDAATQE